METRKIAVACFIGGTLCCAVALMLAPTYWWMGILAGIAGGYLGYEFREFLNAIPVAWKASRRGIQLFGDKQMEWIRDILSQPHPFQYVAAIITLPVNLAVAYLVFPFVIREMLKGEPFLNIVFLPLLIAEIPFMFLFVSWIVAVPLYILAFIGARAGKRCFWRPFFLSNVGDEAEKEAYRLKKKGYREEPLTYSNIFEWTLIGMYEVARFFGRTVWVYFWKGLCRIGRFIEFLFRLIHSSERVLCAIDGTIGGLISYFWILPLAASVPEVILSIIFGGLIGAAFGVLNWEIVSKRILHVATANSQA